MSGIKLRAWGDYACFTRPEMKAERVSYDIMTPSAARAILSAIYWKPEIEWIVDKIHVLQEIKFANIRRNELGCDMSRTQRFSMILRYVEYVIEAHFIIVGGENNPGKHLEMFNRRAATGQAFNQPYLGCREFSANFELIDSTPLGFYADSGEKDLGIMLYDIDFENNKTPQFFHAKMKNGVVNTDKGLIIK
jgi:CRISPR-associated protein Cas5d